jgi:GNAT superfamily N-acetyltransferase
MNSIDVDRANPEDAPELTSVAFAAKRHWGYPESWIREWTAALTFTPQFIREHVTFRANMGGELLGAAAIEVSGDVASIVHLWVLPKAMGRGVGAALFAACEAAARSVGAKRLTIESDPHAEGFYRRMGACLVGRIAADPMVPNSFVGDAPTPRFLPLLEKRLD